MRLTLVTTTHYLLALDDRGQFYCLHTGKGLYYGIAKSERHIYVACRNSIRGLESPELRAAENGSILVLDAQTLALIDDVAPTDFALRDVHGLAFAGGRLYVTCSFDNLVAIWDVANDQWEKWYPSLDTRARDCDVHHFNTIGFHENKIVLLAHNNGASQLFFYDSDSLDLCHAEELGRQAHNIFSVDGALAVCSSGEGSLISCTGWQLRTGGFPRGVDFSNGSILVGISQIAPRAERNRGSSILRQFNSSWRYRCDYLLADTGMVLDILSVEVDEAVKNQLEPFPSVDTFVASYNDIAPGNLYYLGTSNGLPARVSPGEWHDAENSFRWTAARQARMKFVANPGENAIAVTAVNAFPGAFDLEVLVNGQIVGAMVWSEPGQLTASFTLPEGTHAGEFCFRVPRLWQPAKCITGSTDERKLGIAIATVRVERTKPRSVLQLSAPRGASKVGQLSSILKA